MKTRETTDMKRKKLLIMMLITVLVISSAVLTSCRKKAETSEKPEPAAAEETTADKAENAQVPEGSGSENAAENSDAEEPAEEAADTSAKKTTKKEEKKNTSKKTEKSKEKDGGENTASKTAQKKWVDPVYKTVEHPEEGHYETETEWYCLCGKYVGSKDGWKQHREEFLASNGGVCNGEHVRPDPKEVQVWVVDKPAWTEKVLVSEGHWE